MDDLQRKELDALAKSGRQIRAEVLLESQQIAVDAERAERRDRFAAAALTGMLANPETCAMSDEEFAECAASYADDLIAALDKP